MKLIFMGTPAFAVPSLKALYDSEHQVAAVVTAPDKARGRGRQMQACEVAREARKLGLPFLQPENLRDPAFLSQISEIGPDILVVVAFRILPPELYTIPRFGAINAHASLLPKYRGAAPINWAIYHGEKETGISVFQIERKVDTGRIILQKTVAIPPEANAGDLSSILQHSAAAALKDALDAIENDTAKALPQDNRLASTAPKLHSDSGKLDFHQNGEQLCRTVRAFTPKPGAFFELGAKRIKVLRASFQKQRTDTPGKIELLNKHSFAIHCSDGYFLPEILCSPGRRALSVRDWLNGTDIGSANYAGQ